MCPSRMSGGSVAAAVAGSRAMQEPRPGVGSSTCASIPGALEHLGAVARRDRLRPRRVAAGGHVRAPVRRVHAGDADEGSEVLDGRVEVEARGEVGRHAAEGTVRGRNVSIAPTAMNGKTTPTIIPAATSIRAHSSAAIVAPMTIPRFEAALTMPKVRPSRR